MELLQELVHYKSPNIEKNCKDDITRFISLLCLWKLPIFSVFACAANNRKKNVLILFKQGSFSESSAW